MVFVISILMSQIFKSKRKMKRAYKSFYTQEHDYWRVPCVTIKNKHL